MRDLTSDELHEVAQVELAESLVKVKLGTSALLKLLKTLREGKITYEAFIMSDEVTALVNDAGDLCANLDLYVSMGNDDDSLMSIEV